MNEFLKSDGTGQPAADKTLEALRLRASERRRLRYLEGVIPLLLQKLREMKRDAYGGIRVTQSWAFQPGRPGVGDPTAAVAARAADITADEEYRKNEQHLRKLMAERDQLRRRQELFRCCLNALPEEQQFLIEAKVLEDRPWAELEQLYENRYGMRLHRDTLRRRLTAAIRTMRDISA